MSAEILHFVPMKELPNRIRELRLAWSDRFPARGKMSQQRLADMLGYSKMTISHLERGEIALSVEHMRRIGEALSVEPADLLLDRDNTLRPSDDERRMIEMYRAAEPEQREQIQRVIEAMISMPVRNVA